MFADDLGLRGGFLISQTVRKGVVSIGLDSLGISIKRAAPQVMNVTRVLFLRNMILGVYIVAFSFNIETCNAHLDF
jgi:hypothetical protein